MSRRKSNKALSKDAGASVPQTGTPGAAYNPVTKVGSMQEFHQAAERLRSEGLVEIPGYFGGGDNTPGRDYGEYLSGMLSCQPEKGKKKGKAGFFPLLHVSSGQAVDVKAAGGHEGRMITWGAWNRVPNTVSYLCELLPYTAVALKFNIDLCCGMGPQPMYDYTQYVGGNITHKQIPYKDADKLLEGMIRDLEGQLLKLEEEYPELAEPQDSVMDDLLGRAGVERRKSAARQMHEDITGQIEKLKKDLKQWEKTSVEVQTFLKTNNLLQTFQHLYSDMLQYNICFPEFELQQTYIMEQDGEGKRPKEVPASMWDPKITGLKWRNAKTMRLEQMDDENRIRNVYISNQWLSSPETPVPTKDKDFIIDSLPALSYQSPSADLEKIVREAREKELSKDVRPTHIVMPVMYNEYGHPYYPVPAWYSIFSGDVYTYASLLIADRKKRRDNANVIGRILYLNDTYMQRLYQQRHADTDEDKLKLFHEVVSSINKFLKNRDNMGEPLLAYTFADADGKTYKSWEIVEVEENSKSAAEANKEELAEISSIILFSWGVDSQLIGNTPGTTTRSGGTDLRERYLIKQVNMALMQSLVMKTLDVVAYRNGWDEHLRFTIKREVLTTLDNSKTGVTEAEDK